MLIEWMNEAAIVEFEDFKNKGKTYLSKNFKEMKFRQKCSPINRFREQLKPEWAFRAIS